MKENKVHKSMPKRMISVMRATRSETVIVSKGKSELQLQVPPFCSNKISIMFSLRRGREVTMEDVNRESKSDFRKKVARGSQIGKRINSIRRCVENQEKVWSNYYV